jgi:hypothetical protein
MIMRNALRHEDRRGPIFGETRTARRAETQGTQRDLGREQLVGQKSATDFHMTAHREHGPMFTRPRTVNTVRALLAEKARPMFT